MSLLFIAPFLATVADDAANTYVSQIEKCIMTAWHLRPYQWDGALLHCGNRQKTLGGSGRKAAIAIKQG